MTFWSWIVSWLVWLSADPATLDLEAPRAAAAVASARASMLSDAPSPPAPTPTDCDCGRTCVRGVWKPDDRVEQRCACKCSRCVAERAKAQASTGCKDGTCQRSSSAGR